MVNNIKRNLKELTLHFCHYSNLCNDMACQKLLIVLNIHYLDLTFDKLSR